MTVREMTANQLTGEKTHADDSTAEEFELVARDGVRLFARRWQTAAAPIAAVGIVHGLGEHCGRYETLARRLVERRVAVVAFDHRGHGRSPGRRGHVPRYESVLDDIGRLIDELPSVDQAGRPLPRFLLGQSLGGNFVLNYVLRRTNELSGVVALSPLVLPAVALPSWKVFAARLLNLVWPSFTFQNGIRPEQLTHDPDAGSRYRDDPLIHPRVSARLAVSMFAAGRWLLHQSPPALLPVLLMHGGDDTITSAEASRRFALRVGERVTFQNWEGQRHELLTDSRREDVIAAILAWLNERIQTPRPSA
jgi:alpha-beta hydrolase superfamily lysophospholipase